VEGGEGVRSLMVWRFGKYRFGVDWVMREKEGNC